MNSAGKTLLLTIGHTTRSIKDFIALLTENETGIVADVRTVPRSRHNPQFNRDVLPESLGEFNIGYQHMAKLGGLRHPRPDSVNKGWQNAGFRGFADYMQTREFEEALEELIHLAGTARVAVMCAEAVPWRCHRSLIADALIVRGMRVVHILNKRNRRTHTLTSFAEVHGMRIIYP